MLTVLVALLAISGCATLGGTTRRFESADVGQAIELTSQRAPAEDRFEVRPRSVDTPGAARAQVTRVRVCRVRRRAPRSIVATTERRANRELFGAEVTLAIFGAVVTGVALSTAAKACPNGNPDTCDAGKATALLAGAATAPFLVSTVADLALTGGGESSRSERRSSVVETDLTEECGSEPAAHVPATLTLPGGEEIHQISTEDGEVTFELSEADRARFGPSFIVTIVVDDARSSGVPVEVNVDK
jgi:hypothetical protein